MKIIDLLNKIAKGEEVPKQIKFDNKIYTLSNLVTDYMNEDGNYLTDKFDNFDILIDEVEIIEEDKKIETINNFTSNVGAVDDNNIEEYIHKLFEQEFILFSKINEILDYINKGD